MNRQLRDLLVAVFISHRRTDTEVIATRRLSLWALADYCEETEMLTEDELKCIRLSSGFCMMLVRSLVRKCGITAVQWFHETYANGEREYRTSYRHQDNESDYGCEYCAPGKTPFLLDCDRVCADTSPKLHTRPEPGSTSEEILSFLYAGE